MLSQAAPAAVSGPQLRPLQLPPEPHWFPPAPGWWLLLAVLLAVGIGLLWRERRRRRARWQRQAARRELAALQRRHANGEDPCAVLAELSTLLRRAMLRLDPACAGLHGSAWLQRLDGLLGERGFDDDSGRLLIEAPYQRPSTNADQIATGLPALWPLATRLLERIEQQLAARERAR